MFNAKIIACQIRRNVSLHLSGHRSRNEFDYRAKALWGAVSQGEMRIIGSACAKRHDAVSRELGTIIND